jgi:hypothetical protein
LSGTTIKTATDIATLVGAAGAGLTALGDTRLANLDATVSSRSTVAGILTGVIEGTITLQQAWRLALAVLTGKSSGGGTTTIKFRDTADSIDRISATVDVNGNRSSVTRDVT